MRYFGRVSDAKDLTTKEYVDSNVSVSSTGTATDEVKYITIGGVEKKLASGNLGYEELEMWNTNPGTLVQAQSEGYTVEVHA